MARSDSPKNIKANIFVSHDISAANLHTLRFSILVWCLHNKEVALEMIIHHNREMMGPL